MTHEEEILLHSLVAHMDEPVVRLYRGRQAFNTIRALYAYATVRKSGWDMSRGLYSAGLTIGTHHNKPTRLGFQHIQLVFVDSEHCWVEPYREAE